jgi:Polyketide cyclase / dehydrase and lipid transport
MKSNRFAMAVLALTFSVGAAQAITVHRSVTVNKPTFWVWWQVGGFCEISDWLPLLSGCDDWWEDGARYRKLTTTDGATVTEKLTEKSARSYSYDITESPLPVADYHATFSVTAVEGGTQIDWTAHFKAHNATNAEAAAVIAGIFEAGLNHIVEDLGP